MKPWMDKDRENTILRSGRLIKRPLEYTPQAKIGRVIKKIKISKTKVTDTKNKSVLKSNTNKMSTIQEQQAELNRQRQELDAFYHLTSATYRDTE